MARYRVYSNGVDAVVAEMYKGVPVAAFIADLAGGLSEDVSVLGGDDTITAAKMPLRKFADNVWGKDFCCEVEDGRVVAANTWMMSEAVRGYVGR